jgi:predicted component of type VI protein secretion system
VLKPEAAKALTALRERTGRTYSAIIEGLLLAEQARRVRRAG